MQGYKKHENVYEICSISAKMRCIEIMRFLQLSRIIIKRRVILVGK